MHRLTLTAGVLAMALVAWGCGDDGETTTTSSSSTGGNGGMGGMPIPPNGDVRVDFAEVSSETIEMGNFVAVELRLTGELPITQEVEVTLTSTPGTAALATDYVFGGAIVKFPPGSDESTVKEVTIDVLEDNLVELPETLLLTVSNPVRARLGENTEHTLTINDNEAAPTLDFELEESSAEEAGTVSVNVVVGMDFGASLADDLTFDVMVDGASTAAAGEDYVNPGAASQLVVPKDSDDGTIVSFELDLIADLNDEEPDEQITLRLVASEPAVLGTVDTTVVTIVDDDLLVGSDSDTLAPLQLDAASPLSRYEGIGLRGLDEPHGAALDEANGLLYLLSNGQQDGLYAMDIASRTLASLGQLNYRDVNSLAYDPTAMMLFAVDNDTQTLLRIDPGLGRATVVGQLGAVGSDGITALAYDSLGLVLYGYDSDTQSLVTLDTSLGTLTTVGAVGAADIDGLAFDLAGGVLYGSNDLNGGELYTIDTNTGVGTAVAAYSGLVNVEALAFDDGATALYGVDDNLNRVATINVNDATTSFVTGLKVENGVAAAFNPATGRTWLTTGAANGMLFEVDVTTGEVAQAVPLSDPSLEIVALAYNTSTTTLYGFDQSADALYTIDTSTGAVTAVGAAGASSNIVGMVFAGASNILFVVNSANQLSTMDAATGVSTLIGSLGQSGVSGLTFDSFNSLLYGLTDGGTTLVTIDTLTGAATTVGATGGSSLAALTFDSINNQLLAADDGYGCLANIDAASGAMTGIGYFRADFAGMAWDPNNGRLWAVTAGTDQLWRFDGSIAAAFVGTVSTALTGLAYDSDNNILYGSSSGALHTLDINNAGATSVGGFGVSGMQGLAYDPSAMVLYAMPSSGLLHSVNTTTGLATPASSISGFSNLSCLAFDPQRGRMYAASRSSSPELISIDTATGLGTSLRTLKQEQISALTAVY